MTHCATVIGEFSQACRVAYSETEEPLVLFHGDDFLAEGHESSPDNLYEVLGAFETTHGSDRWSLWVSFLHRRIRWNESGSSYQPNPKHVNALAETVSLEEDARLVATPFTRDT